MADLIKLFGELVKSDPSQDMFLMNAKHSKTN